MDGINWRGDRRPIFIPWCGYLGHGTVKLVVSGKRTDELSDFLPAESDVILFG